MSKDEAINRAFAFARQHWRCRETAVSANLMTRELIARNEAEALEAGEIDSPLDLARGHVLDYWTIELMTIDEKGNPCGEVTITVEDQSGKTAWLGSL